MKADKSDYSRIQAIAETFGLISMVTDHTRVEREKMEKDYQEKGHDRDAEDADDDIGARWLSPFVEAIREERFDLIVGACKLIAMEEMDKNDPKRIKMEAKWIAYKIGTESAMENKPLNKTDIVSVMKVKYPAHYEALPTGTTAMREFWRDIGLQLEQSRSGSTKAIDAYLRMIRIEDFLDD